MRWNKASHCQDDGKSMKTETATWSEFPNGGKAIVEQVPVSRKKEIQKRRTVRITVWDLSWKVSHLSKVIWDRKITTEFTRSTSSSRIGKPVLVMDVKVSKDKHICRWVDRENLICVRWKRIKNHASRQRKWSTEEKEVRHWLKVNPVENIRKNLPSFLEISPVQKELHSSHKLWDHAYKY